MSLSATYPTCSAHLSACSGPTGLLLLSLLAAGPAYAQGTRPAADSTRRKSAKQLDEVVVKGQAPHQYNVRQASGSLRVRTPLVELPQNIQEITQQTIADQQALNINERVSRNVSGVVRNAVSEFFDSKFNMRGGEINTLRNGVDLTPVVSGPTPADAAIIDRVEFVKGPAGFLNSVGDPGGSANVVTKQPTGQTRYGVSATVGSYELYRLALDLDGNLTRDHKLQYRLNAVGIKSNSFVNYQFYNRLLIAPVLKYQLSDRTSLTAEYTYQQLKFAQYASTVFSPLGFKSTPLDFTVSDPNLPPYRTDEHNGFLTLQHAFSSHWAVTARGALVNSHTVGSYFFVRRISATTPTILQRDLTNQDFVNTVYSAQAFVNGEFATGAVSHRVLGGIDANWKKSLAYNPFTISATRASTIYPLAINNPVYGISVPAYDTSTPLADRANSIQRIAYVSGYVQEETALFDNRLRLTAGGRFTYATTSQDNRVAAVVETKNTAFTPRLGVSYSVLPSLSVYGVYDRTFQPQVGQGLDGGPFAPLRGRNLEAGVKKDWLNGVWSTTVAAFNIKRTNILTTDPTNVNYSVALGETTTKGVEVDVRGQVAPGLSVVVNYAFTDAYVREDTRAGYVGLRAPFTAKHNQNTWATYALPLKKVKGFTASAGYQYQLGRSTRYLDPTAPAIADFFCLDTGLGWANRCLSVNVLVNNVLDKYLYYNAWTRPVANGPLYAWVPAEPRNYRVTVAYHFDAK